MRPAQVRPQVHGITQVFVAGPAQMDHVQRSRVVVDRGGPGKILQALRALIKSAFLAQFAQEPRPELGPGAGERAEEIMIGMTLEKALDFD